MTPHEIRRPGYYAASHWFQGAVFLAVAGLLAYGILSALNETRERVERESVELAVRNMRTGMQLAMGEALMHQRESELASWAGSNPVRWLGSKPVGYRGECAGKGGRVVAGGEWCFDMGRRELVYRPRADDRLSAPPDVRMRQCEDLRWRVARVSDKAASGGFVGLRLERASPCQWRLNEIEKVSK